MRVCMVTSVPMPPTEGIGHYVWNLTQFLVGKGHQVQIITRGQRNRPDRETRSSVPIWRPRFYPTYPLHVHLHRLFVQRLLRRLEPQVDLFHLHTPLPPPVRTSRPVLVTVHTPMLAEAGAIWVTDLRSLLIRLQMPVSVGLERCIFERADRVTAVAYSVAQELASYGLDAERVQVLGNGVCTDLFCPNGRHPATESPYILAAGRLDVRKGFGDLIEAMVWVVEHHPAVKLYIAGSGPMEGVLRARVRTLNLDHAVRFLGYVKDRAQMLVLYRGAKIFAHAAHYEGLPTVLLEAMACEKAVAVTAVSGALDVVRDGANGLLVPPQDPEAMAAAICRLLRAPKLRADLGTAARRTVEQRFSWRVVGQGYLSAYRALVEEGCR